MSKAVLQEKKWVLTQRAFDKFLACLDSDRERAGRQYEMIRSKLISFFEWRNSPFPEDHADEAINRVVRKIDEGVQLRDPSTYVFGIARMLLLEIAKEQHKKWAATDHLARSVPPLELADGSESKVECLRRCLAELPTESRELITQYYQGERREKIINRRRLTERLAIPINALRIKACRIREKLAGCLDHCMEKR